VGGAAGVRLGPKPRRRGDVARGAIPRHGALGFFAAGSGREPLRAGLDADGSGSPATTGGARALPPRRAGAQGRHNLSNSLARRPPRRRSRRAADIARVLHESRGWRTACRWCHGRGVTYVNDSKATNIDSTLKALTPTRPAPHPRRLRQARRSTARAGLRGRSRRPSSRQAARSSRMLRPVAAATGRRAPGDGQAPRR